MEDVPPHQLKWNGKTPTEDVVLIDIDTYDNAFAEWALQIFGKAIDDYSAMHRFDKQHGLALCADQNEVFYYSFIITDRKRFMLAKIKYGF